MVKCVVSGCPNRVVNVNVNRGIFNRPPKRFFSFPKDAARVKVWLAALREKDKEDSTEQHLICEDHFLPEDISTNGVKSDAIPIMPPYLDGPLGMISPWGAELSEEEDQWAAGSGGDDADDTFEGGDDGPANAEPAAPEPPAVDPPQQDPGATKNSGAETTGVHQRKEMIQPKTVTRQDVSLGVLTQSFLELLLAAPDGLLDLRQVTTSLKTRRRRVYDITNVLEGINLIEKESPNKFKWIGGCEISSFLWKNQQKFQRELENLKLVEDTLDTIINSCAQQLFDMTDDKENATLAYLTHDDISRFRAFQEQTVIVVKAPEETRLEVPAPNEDSIQIHLKGGKGPIMVLTCDIGAGDVTGEKNGCFLTLEESRIETASLHTVKMKMRTRTRRRRMMMMMTITRQGHQHPSLLPPLSHSEAALHDTCLHPFLSHSFPFLCPGAPPLSQNEDDEDDDDDEDYTPGPSTKSPRPKKRRRSGSATSRVREEKEGEEDRWHNREEGDKIPDPLRFRPARQPGPTLDTSASWSPLSLFQLFFSTSVVRTIIANTNANAAKRLQAGLKFVWKPLTVSDFYIFLAIIIFSGIVKVHNRADYWKKEWPYNFRFPADTMTRDRFESILWSLHLSNPAEDEANERKRNTAEYDRLFKIKPLYSEIVNACKVHFQPYQNIAIDERMVTSKARISMKQYMKEKPTKWGYKLFVLVDSLTSYTWNFFVYDGKSHPGQGLSYTSVMDLMEFPLLGRGYTLFVDSYYSSRALFEELSRQNTGACGTIRKKRIGFPQTTQNDLPKNAERGDMRWIRQNKLLFVKWMDTREVTICSTVHEAFSGQTVKRRVNEAGVWKIKDVTIPDAVLKYNQNVGGMDLSDALTDYCSVHHKTMKWYKTFFYHFMDIAVVNSFLLHKELYKKKNDPTSKRPFTQKRFREKLAADMLEFAKASAPPPPPPPPPPATSCMPAYYGDDGSQSRRYCKRCQDAGIKRMKTPVYCMRCEVSLCLTSKRNCFRDWHNKIK
ncbi:piggyBac transposable element-derived protein 4-like isoform X3 [Siniperca chuatsi]|uniref:piggyBac transposable element-derived protein 4-like isoform X3 n=1 Tax=Siniperca chuatsi TaxID=119488 RepID=UPI001CE15BBC|nr:piggyBac transposable element-derived protein 4-like isoform X3 [Siniperca chuatsi]